MRSREAARRTSTPTTTPTLRRPKRSSLRRASLVRRLRNTNHHRRLDVFDASALLGTQLALTTGAVERELRGNGGSGARRGLCAGEPAIDARLFTRRRRKMLQRHGDRSESLVDGTHALVRSGATALLPARRGHVALDGRTEELQILGASGEFDRSPPAPDGLACARTMLDEQRRASSSIAGESELTSP